MKYLRPGDMDDHADRDANPPTDEEHPNGCLTTVGIWLTAIGALIAGTLIFA